MESKFRLATTDEHLRMEPHFTKWWANYRLAHQLNTVPYHLELATRIAALEAWIAAKRRNRKRVKREA